MNISIKSILFALLFSLHISAQDTTLAIPPQSEAFVEKVRTVLKTMISDNEFDVCVDAHQKPDFKVDRAQKKIYLKPSETPNQDDSVLKYQLALAYQKDLSKGMIKEYKDSLKAWKIIGATSASLWTVSAGLWVLYSQLNHNEIAAGFAYGTTIFASMSLLFATRLALEGGCRAIRQGKPTPEKDAFQYMSDEELQQLLDKKFPGSPKRFNKLIKKELEARTNV